VLREHALHNVLSSVDAEAPRDDHSDARATESGVTRFEFDDGTNECSIRHFGSRFSVAMARREHSTVLLAALELKAKHRLSYWDAAIVAAARALDAATLYSEDLNDGQSYGSVTVRNPFA